MASKQLLAKLDFRRLPVQLSGVSQITVRYGAELGKCKGHASARKFIKNYLPMILYNNPAIEAKIERVSEANEAPAIIVKRSDGSDKLFDTRAMAEQFAKAVDREVFKQLTGLDIAKKQEKSRGQGTRRRAPAAAPAPAAAAAAAAPAAPAPAAPMQ